MPLQDLTPQLRTRMRRVERLVGLFVLGAGVLLLAALAYYVAATARRKGWFVRKIPYYIYARDASGLKPGDPVRLLGRDIGQITVVDTTEAAPWFIENNYNVFIRFAVWKPYYGYIWTDSRVRIQSGDFLGKRHLEVSRGQTGQVTVITGDALEDTRVSSEKNPEDYTPLADAPNGVWLQAEEPPALTARLELLIKEVQDTVPRLTNQLSLALAGVTDLGSNANTLVTRLQPTADHLEALTASFRREDGALGRLLIESNLAVRLDNTLASAGAALTNAGAALTNASALIQTGERRLDDAALRLTLTLDNITQLSSNLNAQVQANSLILTEISSLVVNADDLLQGLKRNWLLRGSFPATTNAPLEGLLEPGRPRPR